MSDKTITLYNGVEIPVLGAGTWQISDENAKDVVKNAVEVGYLHIDTAAAYENESGVGRGIKASGIAREKLFVTSKIPAEYKSYELATRTIEESLKFLQTNYIDLMLIHAPRPWDEMSEENGKNYNEENLSVWKALEEGYADGRFRSIGVSNFSVSDLKNIMNNSKIKPMVNQISCFIGRFPKETIEFCKENDIVVEAYSPMATGALLKDVEIGKMAAKYGVKISQLCIKYVLQLGLVALPKTTHKKYMEENAALDFEISRQDMEKLMNFQ